MEEIACQNLAMGLKPASIEGTATPCQTTLVVAVIAAPGRVAPMFQATTDNTYFDFDQSTLTPDGRTGINVAAREALANPLRRVVLVGKTDSTGTDAYNMALSQRRVATVRDAMIANGVPASRIDVQWVGERQLPVAEKEGVREPLNRTVEGTLK